jgi:hypothetical protein
VRTPWRRDLHGRTRVARPRPAGTGEGGEPPGDTLALFRFSGPLQPPQRGAQGHSRRLTRRKHVRGTCATPPEDAVDFTGRILNTTHSTSPVQQRTTVIRTGDCPIPAQDFSRRSRVLTTRRTISRETRRKTVTPGVVVNAFLADCSPCVQVWALYTPPFVSQIWHRLDIKWHSRTISLTDVWRRRRDPLGSRRAR